MNTTLALPGRLTLLIMACCATLAACSLPTRPEEDEAEKSRMSRVLPEESALLSLLDYGTAVARMGPADIARERQSLAGGTSSPASAIRQAMLLAAPRGGTPDYGRAQSLLEAVLRARTPEAALLHPLARLLAAHFHERQKTETYNDRLVQQLKDSQRRNDELQEKLEALANIERSIPLRPNTTRTLP